MSGPAWQILQGLPAWEITEIPRAARPRPGDSRPDAPSPAQKAQRTLALAAACATGAPLAFGWLREQTGGPVRVIAAGSGLTTDAETTAADSANDGAQVLLAVPPGARGAPLPPGRAGDAFAVMPAWTSVAVTIDALLSDGEATGNDARQSPDCLPLDDVLLTSWKGPFAWLVLAVPVPADRLAEMTSETSLAQLTAQRHDSPRAQIAARRMSARHVELGRAATTGLWDTWLLAGASTPAAAAKIAGLLSSAADLEKMPYRLTTLGQGGTLPELLGAPPLGTLTRGVLQMQHAAPARQPMTGMTEAASAWAGFTQPPSSTPPPARAPATPATQTNYPDPVPEFPCSVSSQLLGVLVQPPAREVPGIRFALQPDFDVTPEIAEGGVELGTVLDRNRVPAGTLAIPRGSLNRHVFVCGATGAGKSQTVRHLLESATEAGIPWLVIEPAKAEYKLMAARLPGTTVITIRPGDLDTVPAGVNPLEPAAGPDGARFPLQAHADLVRALFLAAFQADEPFPQVLAAALTRCYEQAGWDLVTGQPSVAGAAYPPLSDLQAAAMTVVDDIGYGQEITDNVRGFVKVRIGSLRHGATGQFLDTAFPLDYARMLTSNVVLEIEDCGDDTDKAFLTGTILIRLTEHLRMQSRSRRTQEAPGLRHLTVVEEAHRLLRQPPPGEGSGPATHAVEMFAGVLAEIRAYGEGLIIAEQIPAKLIPDVIKNTAVKIVHRLPAQDDRDAVGATMNLTPDQSNYLVTLSSGEAAVFTDGMDYPLLARMPDGTRRESGGIARPESPQALVSAGSCPGPCRTEPCTLRQLSAARGELADNPRIRLWAELAVAGHLAGWLTPVPGADLTSDLDALDTRPRDCALAQAVNDAVSARIPAMAARIPAPALAAHVTAALRTALDEGRWLCQRHEPQWVAPGCAWNVLAADLSAWERDHPGGDPYPDKARWEDALGRRVPGTTITEQAAAARRWDQAGPLNWRDWHAILFGTRTPSAIEQAARTTPRDPDRDQRLAAALSAFDDSAWLMDNLRLATPETPG